MIQKYIIEYSVCCSFPQRDALMPNLGDMNA